MGANLKEGLGYRTEFLGPYFNYSVAQGLKPALRIKRGELITQGFYHSHGFAHFKTTAQ
jgi:hypothetical protein